MNAPARRSPWEEVRAKNPGAMLARVILVEKRAQFFVRLNPSRPGAEVMDGSTHIAPRPDTEDAHLAIVRAYDAAWHAQKEAA